MIKQGQHAGRTLMGTGQDAEYAASPCGVRTNLKVTGLAFGKGAVSSFVV
ncbi:MAG TPA: hypothetical protein GX519_02790 [Thermoanaerobacterales bacterium]|nr:hypothetical protein [Thermoanaerobacterales bacterium]